MEVCPHLRPSLQYIVHLCISVPKLMVFVKPTISRSKSYREDLTQVVISYEIYETSL